MIYGKIVSCTYAPGRIKMRLSKLKLCNYRCFGPEEQTISIDKLTTFIGNNSAGKTAALSALNTLFSENINDRTLYRSDFHLPKDIEPNEMEKQELYIEAVFAFDNLHTPTSTDRSAIPVFLNQTVIQRLLPLPGGLRVSAERPDQKMAGPLPFRQLYARCL